MKTRLSLLFGIFLLGLFSASFAFAEQAAPPCDDVSYFPQTGHNVCDQFLDFFDQRGGDRIFGYPLTEWFIEDGRLVQYFQRVRMEYHPENPPEYQVQLGLLGDYFAPPDKKARIPDSAKPKSNDRERRYFSETGHTVGFSFLKFYNENGGLDNFGYPVTEFILENGRFVQYFQRALMEWNPNQGGIVLHNLGEMWIDAHEELQEKTAPATSLAEAGNDQEPTSTPPVTDLNVTASVRDAFTGRDGTQAVWVYVYDQNGNEIQGARVTLTVHYPNRERRFSSNSEPAIPLTDEAGHTKIVFDLDDPPRGQLVVIDAHVNYQGLEGHAQTTFFPWW